MKVLITIVLAALVSGCARNAPQPVAYRGVAVAGIDSVSAPL